MKFLELPKENLSKDTIFGLILIAYVFSIAMRLIWVYQFNDEESFHWMGQLMINTNDGYFFASGAQTALENMHTFNPRDPSWLDYGVTFLTVLVTKLTPISLETVTLFMPAFVASLVVIPIILIGTLFNAPLLGFFAALIGSIAWSYYNRTMTGYYDTDMFAAMAPMFVLYFLINSIEEYKLKSALYASLAIIIYPFLYDQGRAVVFAMAVIYFIYLVIFHKNETNTYKSIILVSSATFPIGILFPSPISYLIQMAVVSGIYFLLQKKELELKKYIYLSIVSVLLFLYFGNVFSLVLGKVFYYLDRSTESVGLHFFQVNQTIREAGTIPFETMANRISGSTIGVIVSLIGYILLVIRYRPFILALPLIGIGVFSLIGGLRFTVYAVPIAAIGAVYLFYVISNFISNRWLKYSFIALMSGVMLYPNITHIIEYKVPTVFNKSEVKILDQLKTIASPKDYTLTWWDYGYPIWYYSDTNTLIDGGKHSNDNFIISKILATDSQIQAANLARLSVETYIDSNYSVVADTIFKNRQKDQLDPNMFLENLKSEDYQLPQKSCDIYLYLPYKMLGIFPTILQFSDLDLSTGNKVKSSFFYYSSRFIQDKGIIYLGNNISLYKKTGMLHLGNRKVPLKEFITVGYSMDGKLLKDKNMVNPNANISLIFLKSYGSFILLDEKMLNSTFVKLFILEEYDKDLFEPVIMDPMTKIYRLKR